MASFVRREERRRRLFGVLRRERTFRANERYDLEKMSDEECYAKFRFTKTSISSLLAELNLTVLTARSRAVSPLLQLLVCLRFLGTGTFYSVVGDGFLLSKSTVGRIVREVVPRLAQLSPRYIKWPSEIADIKRRFYNLAGFPNVVGAIDGTFVKIQAPQLNESDYVNRKGYYSLNVQMTCDASLKITSCVAKWPGSVHDSRVFRDSSLSHKFETGQYSGFLLGDSAYSCKSYLLTPFLNPTTPSQINYNKAHCRTRVLIEQTFGILKRCFACLHFGLRVNPISATKIITACAVLHNFGIEHGDILQSNMETDEEDNNEVYDVHDNEDGKSMRNSVARRYFS